MFAENGEVIRGRMVVIKSDQDRMEVSEVGRSDPIPTTTTLSLDHRRFLAKSRPKEVLTDVCKK